MSQKEGRLRSVSLILTGLILGAVMIAPAFANHSPAHTKAQFKKVDKRIAKLSSKVKKLPTTSAVQQLIGEVVVPFAAFLDVNGETRELVTHGPLKYSAKCLINDGGVDKIQVFVDSTAANWQDTNTGGGAGNPANTPVKMFESAGTTNNPYLDRDTSMGSAAVQSAGKTFSLGIDGQTLALGLNVFGHRCYVAGHAAKTTL